MLIVWSDINGISFSVKESYDIEYMIKGEFRKYVREIDNVRHLIGLLLAEYGREILMDDGITLIKQEKGRKPYYVDSFKKFGLEFNISHSGNIVACAIAYAPVGLDLEKVRIYPREIVYDFFCEEEIVYSLQNERNFYKLWTRKESYLKATGEGIRNLRQMVPLVEGGRIKDYFRDFEFKELYIDQQYETVVCAPKFGNEIKKIKVNRECLSGFIKKNIKKQCL